MSGWERSILGAILVDGRLYEQAEELRPGDFTLDPHRRIFRRMGDLAAMCQPIDILTLVEELEIHKELQVVGGVAYVSGLIDGIPDRPSIQHYVKMMHEAGDRKRAAKIVEDAQRVAEDPSVSTAALAAMATICRSCRCIEPLPPRFGRSTGTSILAAICGRLALRLCVGTLDVLGWKALGR